MGRCAKIAAALAVERAHLIEVIGQALGQALDAQCDEHKRDLSEKISELRLELAKFANIVAELRISSVGEGSRAVLDLPPLPTRGRNISIEARFYQPTNSRNSDRRQDR